MKTVLILIFGYFALLVVVAVMAVPARRRLRELGAELLALDLNQAERAYVLTVLRHAYSWRAAILMFLEYAGALFESHTALKGRLRAFEADYTTLIRDHRLYEMADAYRASVVAVSPVFGILTVLTRFAFLAKCRAHRNRNHQQERGMVDVRAMAASA